MTLVAVALLLTANAPSFNPFSSQGKQEPIVPQVRPGQGGRGRDPWVFRAVFEDRTRMVLVAAAPNKWLAFNPETCAFYKVWEGGVDFRGKVWDFSQDNSHAEGVVWFQSPNEIVRLPEGGTIPSGWKTTNVTSQADGWTFPYQDSVIESPVIDLSEWHRVFVAFDETGKNGRFRVDITDRQGRVKPQWFQSATSVEAGNSWQWNFKRIERPSAATQVRLGTEVTGKRLRNFRVYGDVNAWFDSAGKAIPVTFGGYEVTGKTRGVTIRSHLDLANGGKVEVEVSPEVRPTGWQETYRIAGIPPGEAIGLRKRGLSEGVRVSGDAPFENGTLKFTANRTYVITFEVAEAAR